MTKEHAVSLAWEFVKINEIEVAGLEKASYITLPIVDELTLPPDTLATYRSVKSYFKNHWVVSFKKVIPSGIVESPATEMICVHDDGRVIHGHAL